MFDLDLENISWSYIIAYADLLIATVAFIQLCILTLLIFLKKDITKVFFYRRFIRNSSDGVSYMGFSLLMSIPLINFFGIMYWAVSFPMWIMSSIGKFFHQKIEQNQR